MKSAVKSIVMAYSEIDTVVGTEMRLDGIEVLEMKLTFQKGQDSEDYVVNRWDEIKSIGDGHGFRVVSKSIDHEKNQYEILLINIKLLDGALDTIWRACRTHQQNYWAIQGREDVGECLKELQEAKTDLTQIIYTTADMSGFGSPKFKEAIRTFSMYAAYQSYKKQFKQLNNKMRELAIFDESIMADQEVYAQWYVLNKD